MEMTESEIRNLYRKSKDKWAEISILSELNDCTREEIASIVADIPIGDEICQLRLDGLLGGRIYTYHRDDEEVRRKFRNDFGERISRKISESGMSSNALSKKSNISASTMKSYTSGMRLPDIFSLYKISKALGVSADYLIGLKRRKKDGNDGR